MNKLTLVWKFCTGGREGVIDYVLDIANNYVNSLTDATKEKLETILSATQKILSTGQAVKWLVPSKWQSAYSVTLSALGDVVTVCSDLQVTQDELSKVIAAWQIAYSSWRAD